LKLSRGRPWVAYELAHALGLRERSLEVMLWHLRRDVEQRAVHRRGRDALVVGGVLGIEERERCRRIPGTPVRDAGAVTSGRGGS
jgi:hypothetical protein